MTLGERSLEREVLALFDRQAEILLARMNRGRTGGRYPGAYPEGIGARDRRLAVARAAEGVEQANAAEVAAAVDALAAAIAETRAESPALADAKQAIAGPSPAVHSFRAPSALAPRGQAVR